MSDVGTVIDMKNTLLVSGFALLAILGLGCQSAGPSNITPGMAKSRIQPGVTSQAEVVEVFGPPNIVTRREGADMWVYDKVSSQTANNAFGLGAAWAGAGGSGGGIVGGAGGRATTTRSETTVMLIVYFDPNDVVSDYKITQTKF
jgi:outer membrane protein assembly factor BamE (lipoprotein component of BamABCDE complex)